MYITLKYMLFWAKNFLIKPFRTNKHSGEHVKQGNILH